MEGFDKLVTTRQHVRPRLLGSVVTVPIDQIVKLALLATTTNTRILNVNRNLFFLLHSFFHNDDRPRRFLRSLPRERVVSYGPQQHSVKD